MVQGAGVAEEVGLLRDLLTAKRQGILMLERLGPLPDPRLRSAALDILAREARHCALLQERLRELGAGPVLAPTPAPQGAAPNLVERVQAFSNIQRMVADRIAKELDGIGDPRTRNLLLELAGSHRDTIRWCQEILEGLGLLPGA